MLLFFLLFSLLSCNSNNDLNEVPEVLSPFEQLCVDFNNNAEITCKLIKKTDSIITFSGLNKGYIWYTTYDAATLSKIDEWQDDVITDSVVRFYLPYSSSYTEPHKVYDILPNSHIKTNKGEIHSFFFNSTVEENPYITQFGYQTIFTSTPQNRRTRIEYSSDFQSVFNAPVLWYDDSYLIGSCVFTINGDSLYGNQNLNRYVFNDKARVVSYEEVVEISDQNIHFGVGRLNLKRQQNVWYIGSYSIYDFLKIDTNLITDSNVKNSILFVDTNSNIWLFKLIVDIWGTGETEYLFKIDIETGKLVV